MTLLNWVAAISVMVKKKKKKKKKLILAPGANEKRKLLDSLNTPLLQHVTPKLTAQFTERLYLVITKMPSKRNLEHLAKKWKSVIDEIN